MKPENAARYADTILRFTDRELEIDLREPPSPEWAGLFERSGLGAAFGIVTACNPDGQKIPACENAARTEELGSALLAAGMGLGAGLVRLDGCSPDFEHREASFAACLPEGTIAELAVRYEQEAYFWWDGDRFWIVSSCDSQQIRLPQSRGADT